MDGGIRLAFLLTSVQLIGATPSPTRHVVPGQVTLRESCRTEGDYRARADSLLRNVYRLYPHPAVQLPADPTWSEDPLSDDNWQMQFHTVRYARDLLTTWADTGDGRYLDRAEFLLRDWYSDNPKEGAPSPFSWNDHSTAWRASTFACMAGLLPVEGWLLSALLLHGQTLADPDFYVQHGNHALNQNIGLLDVGCVLDRSDWMSLAARRIDALLVESIDDAGVTVEQAIEYQEYNYMRYTMARDRLEACGQPLSTAFTRVARMPEFLAHATLPNGEYVRIGDTDVRRARVIKGTPAEFAATRGASGRKPDRKVAHYDAGYLFLRSGWGEDRPFEDELHLSLRWGPGVRFHGHADGGSVTLYGYGSRLLEDAGKHSYQRDLWRPFFTGRTAHNVVTVEDIEFDRRSPTELHDLKVSPDLVDASVTIGGYADVEHRRRILFSRKLHFLLIEDRLVSSAERTYRQLWHLPPDARPSAGPNGIETRRQRGNILIRQLAGSPAVRVVTGATSPIQGWVSYEYNSKVAAPVLEYSASGQSVRLLTLIVPGESSVSARVAELHLQPDGFEMVVTVNEGSARITVSGANSSIVRR